MEVDNKLYVTLEDVTEGNTKIPTDDDFIKAVQYPELWLQTAIELYTASSLLKKEVEAYLKSEDPVKNIVGATIMPQYYMMAGYTLEAVFKGICVANKKFEVSNGKFKAKFVDKGGHDLTILAREANFELDNIKEWLLKRLTSHTTWAGRYPVPKMNKDIAGTSSNGKIETVMSYKFKDLAIIEEFYKQGHVKLRALI